MSDFKIEFNVIGSGGAERDPLSASIKRFWAPVGGFDYSFEFVWFELAALREAWAPFGLFICHHCDNPPCIRVAHLFLGTCADNWHDMWRKRRARPNGAPQIQLPTTWTYPIRVAAILGRLARKSAPRISATHNLSTGVNRLSLFGGMPGVVYSPYTTPEYTNVYKDLANMPIQAQTRDHAVESREVSESGGGSRARNNVNVSVLSESELPMTARIVRIDETPTERLEPEPDKLEPGQWYWVTDTDDDEDIDEDEPEDDDDDDDEDSDEDSDNEDEDDDEDDEELAAKPASPPWLGCITYVGTNYVNLEGPHYHVRVHLDNLDKRCTRELDADAIIKRKIGEHQTNVRGYLHEVQRITALLGVVPRGQLQEHREGPSTALAVAHGIPDVKAHKQALVLAKTKTLPDLFKLVEKEHEQMAIWMKAQMIPAKSELAEMKTSIGAIDDRIFTVELYAGLIEEITQVKKGKPAANDAKIHLFQRRHYMDEECLAHYEAGGMDYKSIKDFDRWLCRPENLNRILPHPRCIVAFRIRRYTKRRETLLAAWINIGEENADKKTFLYIRNGEQVFRLDTEIDFGHELFPDRDSSTLLGDEQLWMNLKYGKVSEAGIVTQRRYDEMLAERKQEIIDWDRELAEWKASPLPEAVTSELADALEAQGIKREKGVHYKGSEPWAFKPDSIEYFKNAWARVSPDSVYYDDAIKEITREAMEHNRVAVVLQGLLDRSAALQPHPPYRLWTPEGFNQGIELVYDETRTLTDGDAPDFDAYFARLNVQIKAGSLTIGQEDLWERAMAEKENESRRRSWRNNQDRHLSHYMPHGNPGPGLIAPIVRIDRKRRGVFEWMRTCKTARSWREADEPIPTEFAAPIAKLFNVSAYTPGDFKQFYADPRTRQNYLQWAPLLLSAEDHYAKPAKKLDRNRKIRFKSDEDEDEE